MQISIFFIMSLIIATTGCRTHSQSQLAGTGGMKPIGDEVNYAFALVKYEPTFKGKPCSEGQAFFSYCSGTRISNSLAITARHCVIKPSFDTPELQPANVLWFKDAAAVHEVFGERKACLPIRSHVAKLKAEREREIVKTENQKEETAASDEDAAAAEELKKQMGL